MPILDNRAGVPGWKTVRLIGRGSFGDVYEIERDVFGDVERCALKHISIPHSENEIYEMKSEGQDQESITQSFSAQAKDIVSEYKLLMRLNNCPYVVHCHDVSYVQKDNAFGWDIYIRMELLEPLTKRLSEDLQWTEAQIVRLGSDIAKALAACENEHILHRDIKPQNIFVSQDGLYKLGDFGIARIAEKTSAATARIGTYTYMAPEVYHGDPYGSSADIYSLGMVLYWLLNDRRAPFVSENTMREKERALTRRMNGEALPAPRNGSEALKRIVLKACAFDPRIRFRTADELLAALVGASGNERDPMESFGAASDSLPESERNETVGQDFRRVLSQFHTSSGNAIEDSKVSHPPQSPSLQDSIPVLEPEDEGTVKMSFHFDGNEIASSQYALDPSESPLGSEEITGIRSDTDHASKSILAEMRATVQSISEEQQAEASKPSAHRKKSGKRKKPSVWILISVGAIALAVVLVLVFLPKTVASGTCGTGVTWELNSNGVLIISGSGYMTSFANAYTTPWNDLKNDIRQVKVKSGVKTIGMYAFSGCTNLEKAIIGSDVTYIRSKAFSGCASLQSITIPLTLEAVDFYAFLGCDSLKNVSYSGTTSQFESINIRPGNNNFTNAYRPG